MAETKGGGLEKSEAKRTTEKRPVEFKRSDIALHETRNNTWTLLVPAGMEPEDLAKASTLGAAAQSLRPYDTIFAVEKNEAWWAEYLVFDCGVGWATLVLLRAVKLPPRNHDRAERVPAGHEVFFAGMESKWAVHRTRDDVRMRDGFHTREEALRWLLEHASLREQTR